MRELSIQEQNEVNGGNRLVQWVVNTVGGGMAYDAIKAGAGPAGNAYAHYGVSTIGPMGFGGWGGGGGYNPCAR